MFIAHMPAGYLLVTSISSKLNLDQTTAKWVLVLSLLGSVLPDFDLLYFYLIDERQHSHHTYWSHMPAFWIIAFCSLSFLSYLLKSKFVLIASSALFFGTILHLILDTMAGGIYWFYPLTNTSYTMVSIQPKYNCWVLNFILHWTFAIEIAIVLAALAKYRRL